VRVVREILEEKIFLVASKRQFGEANVYNHGMGL
jgi:hypothetical protein